MATIYANQAAYSASIKYRDYITKYQDWFVSGNPVVVGGGGGASGGTPTPPPSGGGGAGSSVNSDLQLLLAGLNRVQDGDIITADHYNVLLDALAMMAAQLGYSPGGTDFSLSYAPLFNRVTAGGVTANEWNLGIGVAYRPTAPKNSANGWLPLDLPDGALIKSLQVTGRKSGDPPLECTVNLLRKSLADASTVPVITTSLKDVSGNPFKKVGEVAGQTAAIRQDLQTIDNTKFKYVLQAELTDAAANTILDLWSFEVVCAPG